MSSSYIVALALLPLAGCVHAQTASAPTPFDPPRRVDLASPSVVVSLEKEGAYYFAPVRINGRPFRFTVETGANFVAISGAALRALGGSVDSIDLPGMGGQSQRTPVVRLDSISIGGATFHGLTARVNPMWDNQGFDGIISVPYFQHLLVSLELSKSRLTFSRGTLPEPNGRDVVPLARRDRGGRIDFDMNFGATSLPVVVDTRSYLPIVIADSFASSVATETEPRSIGVAAGPSQGTFTLRGGRLAGSARIGNAVIARPPIAFRNRPGGVIGVPLLEQIDLTFDLANNRVRVATASGGIASVGPQSWEVGGAPGEPTGEAGPRRAAAAPPPGAAPGERTMGFNLAGFPGTPELRVVNLIRGSDAERVGLRNDDIVVEFDGTPVARMNPGIFRAAVARETPTRIVVKRGTEQMTFSIKPYVVP